jgi:hypothetical protein
MSKEAGTLGRLAGSNVAKSIAAFAIKIMSNLEKRVSFAPVCNSFFKASILACRESI